MQVPFLGILSENKAQSKNICFPTAGQIRSMPCPSCLHLLRPAKFETRSCTVGPAANLSSFIAKTDCESSPPAIVANPFDANEPRKRLLFHRGPFKLFWPRWSSLMWCVWCTSLLVWLAAVTALTAVVWTSISEAKSFPWISVGQRAVGVIAIGQFAVGIITIGQMTVGVFNLSQVGIGLAFSVAMVTGSFGWTLAMVQVSGINIFSMAGISLIKSMGALFSVNLLGPFLFEKTPIIGLQPVSNVDHKIDVPEGEFELLDSAGDEDTKGMA